MLCSRTIAPGAQGLSAVLQALRISCQRAWMASAASNMQQSGSTAASSSSGSPSVSQAQSSLSSSKEHDLQQREVAKQHVLQMAGKQMPHLPRFIPTMVQQPMPVLQALQLVQHNARATFPETVEAHVRLKVNPKRGDQMVRGAAVLPYSLGKRLHIAVFAEGPEADEAREAGADTVGSDELIAQILDSKGKALDFTACLATPDMMPKLVKLGRILGPKGLMPNPKMGTLTTNIAAAISDLRRGRVEFKMDRTGIVHAPLGRVRFDTEQLYANMGALTAALLAAKPEVIKGGLPKYVKSVHLCSTMGRAVPVELSSLVAAMDTAAAVLTKQASQ